MYQKESCDGPGGGPGGMAEGTAAQPAPSRCLCRALICRERSELYSCCRSGNPLRCHGLRDDSHEALMWHWLLEDTEDNRPLFSFNIYLYYYLNWRHWPVFPEKQRWCDFQKKETDLFSRLVWDSSHSHNKPQKSRTLNWFSGNSYTRKPMHWQKLKHMKHLLLRQLIALSAVKKKSVTLKFQKLLKKQHQEKYGCYQREDNQSFKSRDIKP